MPVLAAELDLYPEQLFADRSSSGLQNRRWWVLHTRARQEKCLARQLRASQVPFYLPLISRSRRLRGRWITSYVPLFSGYVFLLADPGERLLALATRRVVRALPVAGQEKLWADLSQVQGLIALGKPITPEDRLVPGSMVEIRSGPLSGMRGKIVQQASGRRFVVEVDFIQRGASVTLDGFTLANAQ